MCAGSDSMKANYPKQCPISKPFEQLSVCAILREAHSNKQWAAGATLVDAMHPGLHTNTVSLTSSSSLGTVMWDPISEFINRASTVHASVTCLWQARSKVPYGGRQTARVLGTLPGDGRKGGRGN